MSRYAFTTHAWPDWRRDPPRSGDATPTTVVSIMIIASDPVIATRTRPRRRHHVSLISAGHGIGSQPSTSGYPVDTTRLEAMIRRVGSIGPSDLDIRGILVAQSESHDRLVRTGSERSAVPPEPSFADLPGHDRTHLRGTGPVEHLHAPVRRGPRLNFT